ncbi:hypothetical protein IE81DRAFT_363690 [Ceraceosorus guamensis]|uniref:Heme haloperoxidase family profile domain-containing protein n=1 Tax=Ceraceosorus guamensis TaxID=1522189 RepID=A0A316WEQ4_9BASI|nr:hypothetical protein IE81DRAFT_363690 [Ceraceosorus guamensis]PWN45855.1 hypothetical protein IE81DRAFT_363690 [Ceraceosorus guamensis]
MVQILRLLPLVGFVSAAMAACPMAELTRRGNVPADIAARYHAGLGLGDLSADKRGDAPVERAQAPPGSHNDQPPLLDPLSGILSPLGLGGLTPRSDALPEHLEMQRRHILERLNERDEDVDIDARVLTPKAQKRHFEERGLIGGLLQPLQGLLAHLDIPAPYETGLKAIPGNDPDHQYKAPDSTEKRGLCPTLNTYIDRSGITTFAEAANAIQEAYSISFDLAVGLSALGLLAGGDIITGKYSLGGQDPRVPNTLGPALGINRHGLFELDGSISRSDAGFGDNHSFNQTKWDALVDDTKKYGGGLFNLEAFKRNAATQIEASRNTNPTYTNGPNFFVNYATRALTARPLPNGTAPNTPDYANVAPFFLEEKFPENWFRIPNAYSLVDLLGDVASLLLFKPQPLGETHNGRFVPLEVNVPTLPEDVACFAFAALVDVAPGQVSGGIQVLNAIKDQLFAPLFKSVKCDIDEFSKRQQGGSGINGGRRSVTSYSREA